MQLDIVMSIENHLSLNISIGTDIESAEDDIEVAGRRRHQQKEEVEVRVAEQTLDDCHIACMNIEIRNLLVY